MIPGLGSLVGLVGPVRGGVGSFGKRIQPLLPSYPSFSLNPLGSSLTIPNLDIWLRGWPKDSGFLSLPFSLTSPSRPTQSTPEIAGPTDPEGISCPALPFQVNDRSSCCSHRPCPSGWQAQCHTEGTGLGVRGKQGYSSRALEGSLGKVLPRVGLR